jgi:DNA-binding PadR family transcriptional regulator
MSKSLAEVIGSKPVRRLKQLLTTGNLWLYILSIIQKKKRLYAYALVDEIEEEFLFRPGKTMVYIVLYKLENEKLITSKFEDRRKYYRLTEKGKGALDSAKEYFGILSKKL